MRFDQRYIYIQNTETIRWQVIFLLDVWFLLFNLAIRQ
jgi:hypothetical protein